MRCCCKLKLIWLGWMLLGCGWANAADQGKPNIVVILTDDVGFGDLSCYNPQAGFQTPTIDRLAQSGMTFTHAHSTAAICMPSRFGLLCGNYVFRGRSDVGNYESCEPCQILAKQSTIADVLRDNGYRTCFVGKWHLGIQFKTDNELRPAKTLDEADLSKSCFDGPRDHGFDETLVLIGGIHSSPYAYFEDDRLVRWEQQDRDFRPFISDSLARQVFKQDKDQATPMGEWIEAEAYRIDNWSFAQAGPLLTRQALEFIDQSASKKQPFFLHLCTGAAHYPYQPPTNFDPTAPDDYLGPGSNPVLGKTQHPRADMVYKNGPDDQRGPGPTRIPRNPGQYDESSTPPIMVPNVLAIRNGRIRNTMHSNTVTTGGLGLTTKRQGHTS